MDKRSWRVKVSGEIHWITTEEKDFYIDQLNQGAEVISLRNGLLILGRNFSEIVNKQILGDENLLNENKWQCTQNTWHTQGAPCVCSYEFIEKNGIMVKQLKRSSEETLTTTML